MDSPQQIEHEVTSQSRVAIVVGGLLVTAGLCLAIFSSTLAGLLVVIIGVLICGFLTLDAASISLTTNQCVIIELQKEIIKELRKGPESQRAGPRVT